MKTIFLLLSLLLCLSANAQIDTTIWLDGSASLRADTFHWRQISGATVILSQPDSAKCQALNLREGRYEFELTCSNTNGVDKDSVIITVVKGVLALDIDQQPKRPRPGVPAKLEINASTNATEIFLQIISPRQQHIDCILYDALGRAIARTSMQVRTGINYVKLRKPRVKGVYYLRFITYYERKTEKLVI